MVWILQDRNARHGRSDVLEQRQPFAAHGVFIKIREPGYIGFRTSRVQHDGTLGSVQDLDKDDWYCVGLDSQCGQSLTTMTSGAELTNSFASACVRSMSPAAQ